MITIEDILSSKVRGKYNFYLPENYDILESIIGLELGSIDLNNALKQGLWKINEVIVEDDYALAYHTFKDVPFMISIELFEHTNKFTYFVFDKGVLNKVRDWVLQCIVKNDDILLYDIESNISNKLKDIFKNAYKGNTEDYYNEYIEDITEKLEELKDDWR